MSPFTKYFRAVACTLALCLAVSCTTFMLDEQADDIMKLDKAVGTMKKPVARDDYKLEKGQRVKLQLFLNDDSIKVYAYPAEVEFLKSNRLLLLYLFEDDFKDGRFNRKHFTDKLDEIVSIDK